MCQRTIFSINYNRIIGRLRPEGDAPILAGLLMGYAGVTSCKFN